MMNRIFPIIAGLFILIGLLSSTIFVVDQRQFAAVFAFGELKRVVEEPGLQFKLPPPFQSVQFFERRILTIDTPDAERFITAEKKNFHVYNQNGSQNVFTSFGESPAESYHACATEI
jgi:membrane protease subunit HflC